MYAAEILESPLESGKPSIHPQDYVSQLVEKSKSSFALPMKFQSRPKRLAIEAVYAFCRIVDDIADEVGEPYEALQRLQFFRDQLEALYSEEPGQQPVHPVMRALDYAVRHFKLPKEYFLGIIEGCEMDVKGVMVKPSLHVLDKYCYNVASCVGLLCINIFGYEHPDTRVFASHLGKAMQLVNILRDVYEDAYRGRIYLPKESLERANIGDITPQEIMENPYRPGLLRVYRELGTVADQYMLRAMRRVGLQDYTNMRPALFMQEIYKSYLDQMRRRHWAFSKDQISLSTWRKMAIFLNLYM